ncbi:EpsG family protein [Orbaceae bacterium ESL0721]|nr:EpsG family protein [Orbaceae bacterium ESL0721]
MIYLGVVFLLFFLSFTNNKRILKLTFLLVGAIFCLTFGYGYDWINYYDIYRNITLERYIEMPFEPGYYLMMQFASKLGMSFAFMHILTTSVIFFLVYKFCSRMKNPLLSFYAIFCFMGFFLFLEQIRQGLAIGMIMLAFLFLEQDKKKYCIFFLSIAISFHLSALVGFLYFFVSNRKNKPLGVVNYILISSLLFFSVLFVFFNPDYISFIPFLSNKIFLYGLMESSTVNSLFVKSSMIYLCLILFAWRIYAITKRKKEGYEKVEKSLISAIFLYQTKIAFLFQRIQYYVVPVFINGLDDFFYRRKIFSIYRLCYVMMLLIIAFMPMRLVIYQKSIFDPIFVFSSQQVIDKTINKRCADLLSNDEENFIIKECLL